MRIVFFGTPEFAVPSLEVLLRQGAGHTTPDAGRRTEAVRVVAAVTQPDRARGRSRSTLEPPPVKIRALAAGIPVLQPERPRGEEFLSALSGYRLDLGVVVAYGHILKPEVLSLPRLGMINVHASLLPAWRGAAPIQWAIANGDPVTGVTVMQMEAGLDSGPILIQRETPVGPAETAGELSRRLAGLGADALGIAVAGLRDGRLTAVPQDHARATLAPKIGRDDAKLDWSRDAAEVARRIRAFDPAPGAWTTLGTLEIKCFRPRACAAGGGPPGTVLATAPELLVAAGSGAVAVGEVQPAGRARMPAADWVRGRALREGDRLH